MRILVTGGTGQDGSYLSEQLSSRGWSVHTFDRRPVEGGPSSTHRHVGSIDDAASVNRLVEEVSPDIIFNLASISSVAASWADPVATAQTNGVAAISLLEAAWRLQERTGRLVRVVQASSAEIFGSTRVVPQDETTPVRPSSPYGAAKAFAHLSVGVYRARGLHASSAILYNHESPRRPPTFVTRKITLGVAQILAGLSDSLPLGNLDAERDWGWAPDYVDALVRMAEADVADDFVIATGVSKSVRDFVTAAFDAVGIDDWSRFVSTDPSQIRPVDAPVLRGDASKAKATLGWAPSVTFEQMIERMVQHDQRLLSARP